MSVVTKTVNGSMVFYDSDYTQRWYDVIGCDAVKHVHKFDYLPITTADTPDGWTTTLVEAGAGETTVALGTAGGGALVITTDAAENDGAQLQIIGEQYDFSGTDPVYFGTKFQVDEATQADFLVGLCITDTTLLGGMTDGMYFRKVDGSTNVEFVMEKGSTETSNVVDTCAADTDAIYEFYWDGTNVYVYVDNVLTLTRKTSSETNFPNNEALTPSIAFLTGAAAAQVMTVAWLRAIQCS